MGTRTVDNGISLAQRDMIQQFLDSASATTDQRKITQPLLDGGRLRSCEANALIQEYYGVTASSCFWERVYPDCGVTIARQLQRYLKLNSISRPTSYLGVLAFKALIQQKSPHFRFRSLREAENALREVNIWLDDYLESLLKEHASFQRKPEVIDAGRLFLKGMPQESKFAYKYETIAGISEEHRKHLWRVYTTILSIAAGACYFQEGELFTCMEHALELFRIGNPLVGFCGPDEFLVLADESPTPAQSSSVSKTRSFTPEAVPIIQSPPSSAVDHAIPS